MNDDHPRDWGVIFLLFIIAVELGALVNNTGGVLVHLGQFTMRLGGFQ